MGTEDPVTAELSWLGSCASAIAVTPEAFDLGELMPRYARAVAAVEAVLENHRKMTLYALSVYAHDNGNPPRVHCGHSYEETEDSRHVMDDHDSIICLDKPEADVCGSCYDESGESEEWPCPTFRAITAALAGKEAGDGLETGP